MTEVAEKKKAKINRVTGIRIDGLPWEQAGAKIDPADGIDAIMQKTNLDWELERCNLKAQRPGGQMVDVPNSFAWARSDTGKIMIPRSGKDWRPLQNRPAINWMKEFAKSSGCDLESIGDLRKGQVVWGMIRLKNSFEVSLGDRVNGYLLLTVPHVVGRAISLDTISLRLLCLNGMATADHTEYAYRQDHLSDFDFDLAAQRVERATEELGAAERRAKTIAKLKLSIDDAIRKVLVPVFEPDVLKDKEALKAIVKIENQPKTIAGIVDSINNAPGAQPGTGWGVLNGVTHYADHKLGHNARTRMFRSWLGDMAKKKLAVEHKLLELAK